MEGPIPRPTMGSVWGMGVGIYQVHTRSETEQIKSALIKPHGLKRKE